MPSFMEKPVFWYYGENKMKRIDCGRRYDEENKMKGRENQQRYREEKKRYREGEKVEDAMEDIASV